MRAPISEFVPASANDPPNVSVTTLPLTAAASLHWLATCRDTFLFEDCVEDSPLRHELTVEKVQAKQGWIDVPDGPGLGVTLNEDFVKSTLIAESR